MSDSGLPSLSELARATAPCEIVYPSDINSPDAGSLYPSMVAVDSRRCGPGALFVALPGSVADGHRYVDDAARAGAIAAIVRSESAPDGGSWPVPVLVTDDALQALHDLAAWYVDRHLSASTTRVGITGSNGKTTTKEMLAAMLRTAGDCFASAGNLNSETGLPLSVLATPPGVRFAVYEMAMSNPGEMAPLAAIVRPHTALVTNIGTAHIGSLGSREAIAREKKQIAARFTGRERLFVPEDDDFRDLLSENVDGAISYFGERSQGIAIVERGGTTLLRSDGDEVAMRLPGTHNARNALAALALAESLGVERARALKSITSVRVPAGRAEVIEGSRGITVLNDAYNANPDSMVVAMEMARARGVTVLVLGDMYELGSHEACAHDRVLRIAAESGARSVWFVGERFAAALNRVSLDRGHFDDAPSAATGSSEGPAPPEAAGLQVRALESVDQAIREVPATLKPGDVVLLKGSRAVALERLLPSLTGEERDA
jgi:UDP-N-acetylmuramoyl-tripeptide--D-alanyl-D-alanine ligase